MIERIRHAHYARQSRKHAVTNFSGPTELIWSLGYSLECDITPFRDKCFPADYFTGSETAYLFPENYIYDVQDGNTVWITANRVHDFATKVLPKLKARVTLVISDGDDTFPSALERKMNVAAFINHPRILAIFSQNYDGSYPSGKIHNLPIGNDFHTINRNGGFWGSPQQNAQEQEKILKNTFEHAPQIEARNQKAFVDFHLSDRKTWDGTRRSDIYRMLSESAAGCIDVAQERMARSELWKQKANYAFSISPHGAGLDCHRTWEDLCLGCIVIVKTSSLDSLYEGLPVVIVKDWREVNPSAMSAWFRRYAPLTRSGFGQARLRTAYWMQKIRRETASRLL